MTAGLNQEATKELRDILGEQVLDYPKPVSMLKGFCSIGSRRDDIVMDFFAGSGTTAHAVLALNKQDGGHRRFILVQLPEPTDRKDFPTIADITKERVRRVIQKLSGVVPPERGAEEKTLFNLGDSTGSFNPEPTATARRGSGDVSNAVAVGSGLNERSPGGSAPDLGFRVFKLAESNFHSWNAQVPHEAPALQRQLELHIDHIREGRTSADILYELLLKSGFPLTTPVETLTLAGQTVQSVAGGALMLCLEPSLTLELIRAIADRKPERVVCLDEGFAGNDQLKANAVQIFKTKGVTSFKTV